MKINVVTVESGWILQKIAERIAAANPAVFDVSHKPSKRYDANFYVDIMNCFKGPTKTIDVGFFSHLHANDVNYFHPQMFELDFIIHMCNRYYDICKKFYPENRMEVLYPVEIPQSFKIKKPIIGVFQRGLHEGKGNHFIVELFRDPIVKNFKWLLVGKDWDELYNSVNENEWKYPDNLLAWAKDEDYSEYPKLYSQIDYLLIPSLWEGGPMSVVEAKAVGIPIIAADVGWCGRDFKVEHLFEPNNLSQLKEILDKIIQSAYNRREEVFSLNFKYYTNKLIKIVEGLKNGKN